MDTHADSLDLLDRQLLLALLADPMAPFSRLATELGVSAATLTARYRRLHRRGLVRITGRTHPGFGGGHVYLVRALGAHDRIAPLAASLAEYANSRWVRISTDGGELMCGVVADNPATDPILVRLPAEANLRSVEVAELLHVWGGTAQPATHHSFVIDAIDRALLHRLSVNGRASLRELAGQLGVNASTISRHRQALIDAGVLYFEADVHPDALDGTGDAMVWITVPPGAIRRAGQALHHHLAVRFVAATSGRFQLVAHVHLLNNAALLDFVDTVLAPVGASAAQIIPMGRVLKRNAV